MTDIPASSLRAGNEIPEGRIRNIDRPESMPNDEVLTTLTGDTYTVAHDVDVEISE